MRKSARLLLAAAVGAAVLVPVTNASAMYCGTLQPACRAVCTVGYKVLGASCIE